MALDRQVFQNTPDRDYSLLDHQQVMKQALQSVREQFGGFYPLIIDGREVSTERELKSTNPARPSEVVGRTASATRTEAEMAITAAKRALPAWRDVPPGKRADIFVKAGEIAERERDELAAWMVYEVGKNWKEADADICEAIDFFRYYAQEMIRLGTPIRLGSTAGETNYYFYEPKGVAVVIPPWNFPMAICAGMAVAAMVAGNAVVLKPASQSPVIAAKLVEICRRAGVPDGVINYLPGPGSEIGDFIVEHPDVYMIAFTGSREIGCRINKLAADVHPSQDHLKKVICEMGGKNAIIVDTDADIDEAVQGSIVSAFGYQGQKCSASSRIIALEPVYDEFLSRLVEAAEKSTIGMPENLENFMGPVIDAGAMKSILNYIEIGKSEGRLALQRDVSDLVERTGGYFIGPTIFADVPPSAKIAQEEIFGPVVAVMKAKDLDDALEIALGTDYALTGGFFSNSRERIERVMREFRVGNLYINRKITGAMVARQPFGGFKMSGIGSKAGGPDYLLQFMDPRVVTENTMRRGFAPVEEQPEQERTAPLA